MQTANPKDILTTLHLIRAGLAAGVLTKDEVLEWADKIVTEDKQQPDTFFIDLLLSSSKSTIDIVHDFNEYLKFEKSVVSVRPLLGIVNKRYNDGAFSLEQTVKRLYRLKLEVLFTEREENFISFIDSDYDCAINNIYSTVEDVQKEVEKFLSFYKDYALDNPEQWPTLDNAVDCKLEQDAELQQQQTEIYKHTVAKNNRPWWKFW